MWTTINAIPREPAHHEPIKGIGFFLAPPVKHQPWRKILAYIYDPGNDRPVLAVRLKTHEMARVDEARHRMKLSRSDLARRALSDLFDKLQAEAASK